MKLWGCWHWMNWCNSITIRSSRRTMCCMAWRGQSISRSTEQLKRSKPLARQGFACHPPPPMSNTTSPNLLCYKSLFGVLYIYQVCLFNGVCFKPRWNSKIYQPPTIYDPYSARCSSLIPFCPLLSVWRRGSHKLISRMWIPALKFFFKKK